MDKSPEARKIRLEVIMAMLKEDALLADQVKVYLD
jgi:hypothetical protein